jgi:hypothetical protein
MQINQPKSVKLKMAERKLIRVNSARGVKTRRRKTRGGCIGRCCVLVHAKRYVGGAEA